MTGDPTEPIYIHNELGVPLRPGDPYLPSTRHTFKVSERRIGNRTVYVVTRPNVVLISRSEAHYLGGTREEIFDDLDSLVRNITASTPGVFDVGPAMADIQQAFRVPKAADPSGRGSINLNEMVSPSERFRTLLWSFR